MSNGHHLVVLKILTAFSALLSFLVIAPVSYMSFDTEPPYVYDKDGSYIVPERTHAGHQITVHWKLRRVNRICPGFITRNIVDAETGVRVMYDPVPATQSVVQGDSELNRAFLLPSGIGPGRKLYYSEGAYGCNLLQRLWKPLQLRTPTLEFEILPH